METKPEDKEYSIYFRASDPHETFLELVWVLGVQSSTLSMAGYCFEPSLKWSSDSTGLEQDPRSFPWRTYVYRTVCSPRLYKPFDYSGRKKHNTALLLLLYSLSIILFFLSTAASSLTTIYLEPEILYLLFKAILKTSVIYILNSQI